MEIARARVRASLPQIIKWMMRLIAANMLWSILVFPPTTPSATAASTAVISNVIANATTVAQFDLFQVQFDVATSATHLDWPYTTSPPPGLPGGTGITVDALFSNDNWRTTITQPAFFNQPYTHTTRDNRDHFVPNGAPRWTVRFTPQQTGAWQYRLRAQDASGTTTYPASGALTFTVAGQSSNLYKRRGFLRVSPTDKRYFEFQDGTPFIGVGFNDGFDHSVTVNQKLARFEQNKMNLMRVWLAGAGINGSQWSSWASHHLSNDGYLPGVLFDTQNTYNGADVSLKLDNTNPCYYADFWQGAVPATPNTTYRVTARVKLSNVTGPAGAGAFGFVIKQAGWLGTTCDQVNGTPITIPLTGTTDWTTVTGLYTTGANQYWLDFLYFARQNATGGTVYIDDVRVWRENDPARVNLLREPNANSHLYFDPMNAAKWDKFIESAEQRGVYLKIVIDEKNEWIKNRIAANGTMTTTASNDNFYAAPNTKVRFLQQAWWRYLIARWGYSTAIHSFEYINEGDPYNGNHHQAANAMAQYIHQIDPARHMVTTSFWHSFPNQEFWSSVNHSEIDYADLHAYISTGWGADASFLESARTETRPQHVRSGTASAYIRGTDNFNEDVAPRGLVVRGPGEWIIRYWMKANAFTANCGFGSTGGMQRVRWMTDGGAYWGGKDGVVPFNSTGQNFLCTSPAGTFDWRQFSSDRDRNGNLLPTQYRLIFTDNAPHEISILIENSNGTGGEAWIDDIELVSPTGRVVPIIGQFITTPLEEDTAWWNRAYGDLLGGASPVGAQKPLIRGEGGIDYTGTDSFHPDLLRDTNGIWLHNNIWGQTSPGGISDLMWWATETIPPNLYYHYLTFRNFMEGIPLTNGRYRDAGAQTSNANLRAWGQRDDFAGKMHLWIQNTQHTWKRVINGPAISPVSGTITLSNVTSGSYRVTWWNTYATSNPVFLTQTLNTSGSALVLTLPNPLANDLAVKIERIGEPIPPSHWAFLPLVRK